MIGKRQNEILKIIVEEYIKTAKPVGSKSICDTLNCSSATVRNEMSYLEEVGYLEKTHTSSGRVPSELGYRYYVDNLMKPKELTGEEVLTLQTILNNQSLQLSDVITKSMEIISDMTNYTSLVLGNGSLTSRLKKVEVVPINETTVIAIIITDKGHIENKTINIDEKINPQNTKILFTMLSAKNPNIGCKMFAVIFEILNTTVATAIEIPNFAAINGIIGLSIPVQTSFAK